MRPSTSGPTTLGAPDFKSKELKTQRQRTDAAEELLHTTSTALKKQKMLADAELKTQRMCIAKLETAVADAQPAIAELPMQRARINKLQRANTNALQCTSAAKEAQHLAEEALGATKEEHGAQLHWQNSKHNAHMAKTKRLPAKLLLNIDSTHQQTLLQYSAHFL